MESKEVTITRTVEEAGLACTMKSGSLPVLATPQMIAWMEEAACLCLDLPEGQSSVGTKMSVSHDAPSPLGAEITIHAKVREIVKRRVEFDVSAYMNDVCIGKGSHTRFIITSDQFLKKCYGE